MCQESSWLLELCPIIKWLPPDAADPLINVSGSEPSGFQDFQLRSVGISIFPAPERRNQELSIEIKNFRSQGGGSLWLEDQSGLL